MYVKSICQQIWQIIPKVYDSAEEYYRNMIPEVGISAISVFDNQILAEHCLSYLPILININTKIQGI